MMVPLKKEKGLEDLRKELHLLDVAKFYFNKRKIEFVKFLADSSSYASQVRASKYISAYCKILIMSCYMSKQWRLSGNKTRYCFQCSDLSQHL